MDGDVPTVTQKPILFVLYIGIEEVSCVPVNKEGSLLSLGSGYL